MKRVIIIGAGFAGLTAARALSRPRVADILILDRRTHQQSLPLLPDIIGRNMPAAALCFDIAAASRRWGCRFLNRQVDRIALEERVVVTSPGERFPFDALLICAGAEPTFYGRDEFAAAAFTFDSVEKVSSLTAALDRPACAAAVVCGGGYTGVELATNIRRRWQRQRRDNEIIVVERAATLLGSLPEGLRSYAVDNMRRLGITIKTGVEVNAVTRDAITFSDGTTVGAAVFAWVAGMQTPACVRGVAVPQDRQGRIEVDRFLRCAEYCFVAGDAAHRDMPGGGVIRMGVQFALAQGAAAAHNIRALLLRRKLRPYKARDLGYIVPMGNNRSCGVVCGATLYGVLPTALHYLMCMYRSSSLRNARLVGGSLVHTIVSP